MMQAQKIMLSNTVVNSNISYINTSIRDFDNVFNIYKEERPIFIDSYLINTCLSVNPVFENCTYTELLHLALNGLVNFDVKNRPFQWYNFMELTGIAIEKKVADYFVNNYYHDKFIPDVRRYMYKNKLSDIDVKIIVPQYNNLEPTNPIGCTESTNQLPHNNYSQDYKEAIKKLFYNR